jgi:hypothetical protein
MLRSMVRMPGSSWSVVARPSGVISIRTLRRSAGLGDAADPAAAIQQVQGGGHGGRGDQDPVADLGGGQRGAGAVDDGQRRRDGLGYAEGRGDAPVKLAQQGLTGAVQRRVRLGSDIREDLDPRCSLDSGGLHALAQRRVVREAARLLGGGELVRDEQVVAVAASRNDPGTVAL